MGRGVCYSKRVASFFSLFSIPAFLFLSISSIPALGATVSGTVTDSVTGTSLSGAEIMFVAAGGDTVRTFSDSVGAYEIELSTEPLSVDEAMHPQEFILIQNFPNPFNPATTIEFELLTPCNTSLTVYNIMGQSVRRLAEGYMTAGPQRVVWDGRNDSGETVAAGVYLYRLTAGGRSLTKKMLLLDGGAHSNGSGTAVSSGMSVSKAAKTAATRDYVMAARLDGYLLYEDYRFSIGTDRTVDVALEKKSGATVAGEINYDTFHYRDKENWDANVDPIEIYVYDTNDYSKLMATKTVQYPDRTFEITGLPNRTVDIVIQGDDIVSNKIIEMVPDNDMVISCSIGCIMLIDHVFHNFSVSSKSFFLTFKSEYSDEESALEFCDEYQLAIEDIFTFDFISYVMRVTENNEKTIMELNQILNSDARVELFEFNGIASPCRQTYVIDNE